MKLRHHESRTVPRHALRRHAPLLGGIFVCLLETRKVGGNYSWHRSKLLYGPTVPFASRRQRARSNLSTSTATSSISPESLRFHFAAAEDRSTSLSATEPIARSDFRVRNSL